MCEYIGVVMTTTSDDIASSSAVVKTFKDKKEAEKWYSTEKNKILSDAILLAEAMETKLNNIVTKKDDEIVFNTGVEYRVAGIQKREEVNIFKG